MTDGESRILITDLRAIDAGVISVDGAELATHKTTLSYELDGAKA